MPSEHWKGNQYALKSDAKKGRIQVRVDIEVEHKAKKRASELNLKMPEYITKLVEED